MRALPYNDLSADRNTVAVVQALEAILAHAGSPAGGANPGAVVLVNTTKGGLVLSIPGVADPVVLYRERV
jgi:hypothetical protein